MESRGGGSYAQREWWETRGGWRQGCVPALASSAPSPRSEVLCTCGWTVAFPHSPHLVFPLPPSLPSRPTGCFSAHFGGSARGAEKDASSLTVGKSEKGFSSLSPTPFTARSLHDRTRQFPLEHLPHQTDETVTPGRSGKTWAPVTERGNGSCAICQLCDSGRMAPSTGSALPTVGGEGCGVQ